MDVCESEKVLERQSTSVSADKNGTTHRSRTREVSSRYKSPTPSASNGPKRSPSPNVSRTSSTSTVSAPKRAISAERKRPSTPIRDTTAEARLASNKTACNKLPVSLWPSTMRSLSISFQSDTSSVPTGKREKTVSRTPSHKGDTPPLRKRSPLKGKNYVDQLENSKPVDSLRHQWPSRTNGKMSTALNRADGTDKMNKSSSLSRPRMVIPSIRRLSLDGTSKPLQKSASNLLMLISRDESGIEGLYGSSVDDRSLRTKRPGSSSSSDRTLSLPTPGSRPPSPSVSRGVSPSRAKAVNSSSRGTSPARVRSRPPSPSVSRGVSPSHAKAVNSSSRGTSPARVRPSSPSRNPQSSTSVLSFIVDIKKGQKAANNIEDVHQLRLLYNRHLQWRFANARTDAALRSQKAKAERILYSGWRVIVGLWDSVREKRSDLQKLKLKLKLYSILDSQVTFLDEWSSMERDHTNSLNWAIQDLQASTIRIPVTGGARADIKTVKEAVCSAVDVMRSMGSSLCSILAQVEGMNCLVSELADVAACEKAMLDEFESLLDSTAALQVEEYSLRTHVLQMKQALKNGE